MKVIAEIGCNHMGDLTIAKKMIQTAAQYCKADIVKFQKRNPRELLTETQYAQPHPNPSNSYGKTYGEHREYLEFSVEQHKELKAFCEENDIVYSCSVWDITSAKEIASLIPALIKIPSACNNNIPMLLWLIENYQGEIHISVGMTLHAEEEQIISLFETHNRTKDLALYSCTSGYPVCFEDVCLLEIVRLKEKYKGKIKAVGFSGHHNGIAIDIAALALGATFFERHFTLNRTWKGTDHAASLEPDGLRKLKRNLLVTETSLTYKQDEILMVEKEQREKLKYRGEETFV